MVVPNNSGRLSPAFYTPKNNEYCQRYFIERQKFLHRLVNLSKVPSVNSDGTANLTRVSSVNSDGNLEGERHHGGAPATDHAAVFLPTVVDIKHTFSAHHTDMSSRRLLGSSDRNYGTTLEHPGDSHTIRFQVLVWNIGRLGALANTIHSFYIDATALKMPSCLLSNSPHIRTRTGPRRVRSETEPPDVVAASVPMTFRVTLFWNDVADGEDLPDDASTHSSGSHKYWRMGGRHTAFAQELGDPSLKALEVPPLAILNCSTFETIGSPEVDMMCESSRLVRWSCMYRAIMIQQDLRVDDFPHDDHDICIKLAILSQRGKGKQWDRRYWKLALATKEDSQNSTRVPHGLIVDQVRLPGFAYNMNRGLKFQFCALEHGVFDNYADKSCENYLKVSLNVLRKSGHYDKNIVPLLALMNVVAVSVLTFKDTEFFYRALITNNIAFVEVSIRMATDSHLPSVGYQIRLQKVLNEFFFVLMGLNLEAMGVYVLAGWGVRSGITRIMDWTTAALAVFHNVFTVWRYYRSKRRAQHRFARGINEATRKKDFDLV